MMPGKDGITLCKELKSQIITSHIPIILLTARSSTVFEIQGLQTGADDYVTKPFGTAELLARLFNAAPMGVAVGGTSGKSTVTGMIGWILQAVHPQPTVMTGAVMKNYATPDAPFASARVGTV